MQVIKRDGRAVSYDRSKIIVAIQKANAEVEDCEKISEEKIEEIIDGIEAKKQKKNAGRGHPGYHRAEDYGRREIRSCQNLHYI